LAENPIALSIDSRLKKRWICWLVDRLIDRRTLIRFLSVCESTCIARYKLWERQARTLTGVTDGLEY